VLRGGHGFFATDVFCHGCFATDFFATDEHGFSRMKRRVWVGVLAHAKPRSREGTGRVVQRGVVEAERE
jgi:hypothetical protein